MARVPDHHVVCIVSASWFQANSHTLHLNVESPLISLSVYFENLETDFEKSVLNYKILKEFMEKRHF